ncbi:hypothetical protein H310_04970 [Aphanomyces invadans]|uniref:Uncharacterized protein n=1 Tax=Aphanomyces invadans TaxID=157072 RepID=A0A024UD47_9STRA|nr:hypothetical protein H310_04970 [Aphanomyces invadans]ETW03543.1 hypothetical protein H310_04970 [Aphanomyces invadans]|eukprot:XP_008867772.1 hypothetical protein H310_04970 [Aphanomyces invadans]
MDRWTFECCNDKQLLRLSWVGTFTMLIICTWRTPLAYPYKLFAYFTHESFRAATATLTCGQVDAIDIHPEEGSETSFHCGISFLVHVAGYLGSLCLGCLFIASSATDTPRLVCGGAVVLQLVAFTAFSNTRYLRTVHALSLAAALAAGVVAYVVHVSEVTHVAAITETIGPCRLSSYLFSSQGLCMPCFILWMLHATARESIPATFRSVERRMGFPWRSWGLFLRPFWF